MERGCVRDALTKNPDLPWKTIVGMALDAAAGILHLHAEHIVHRVPTLVSFNVMMMKALTVPFMVKRT